MAPRWRRDGAEIDRVGLALTPILTPAPRPERSPSPQGLRLETGASIELLKKSDGSAIVTLGGSEAATRAARAAIERIVLAGPL